MAQSSEIIDGQDMTAAQYNAIRVDAIDATLGHDHSGAPDHGGLVAYDAFLAYVNFEEDREQ